MVCALKHGNIKVLTRLVRIDPSGLKLCHFGTATACSVCELLSSEIWCHNCDEMNTMNMWAHLWNKLDKADMNWRRTDETYCIRHTHISLVCHSIYSSGHTTVHELCATTVPKRAKQCCDVCVIQQWHHAGNQIFYPHINSILTHVQANAKRKATQHAVCSSFRRHDVARQSELARRTRLLYGACNSCRN